ncbi:MAG: NmrA family NAD(P)-binding protein [Chthoniobacterales bacterium]
MYAITGITGKVGGALARALIADRRPVRAVVRYIEKGLFWAAQGCEIALAEMQDSASLTAAFTGADGVFILPPPDYDPAPGFPEARAVIAAVKAALESARPNKVVCLSTIGAQSTRSNLLTQRTLMEQALGELPMPITFLRPGWFMENAEWDVASAHHKGMIASFLQPLDKLVPMVATADIGRVASELLQENWIGKRVVELEGPKRISPQEIGTGFAKILGHAVRVEAAPRETWQAFFESKGMLHPLPPIQMLDGFNEGWIDFEGGETGTIKGKVELPTVLQELVDRAG